MHMQAITKASYMSFLPLVVGGKTVVVVPTWYNKMFIYIISEFIHLLLPVIVKENRSLEPVGDDDPAGINWTLTVCNPADNPVSVSPDSPLNKD